jgi:hypothetical protein
MKACDCMVCVGVRRGLLRKDTKMPKCFRPPAPFQDERDPAVLRAAKAMQQEMQQEEFEGPARARGGG